MQQTTNQPGFKYAPYLGPAFLVFILLAFFVFPGTSLDKFNMVCFGI
jgi:hypothetical protein